MMIVLETEQLILRELTMEDLDAWHMILSDKETRQYYPKPFDIEKTRSWITWNLDNYQKYGFGLWAVLLRETGQFIGDCGITMQMIHEKLLPEIGYHIDKRFWKKGYATQAARACLAWAFVHTEFDEIYSYQMSTNLPSRRVAEKMGMTLREEYVDSVNIKTSVYAITRERFQRNILIQTRHY